MSFLLVQERHNSGANTLELHLSCTYPLMWNHQDQGVDWVTVSDCEGSGWLFTCAVVCIPVTLDISGSPIGSQWSTWKYPG